VLCVGLRLCVIVVMAHLSSHDEKWAGEMTLGYLDNAKVISRELNFLRKCSPDGVLTNILTIFASLFGFVMTEFDLCVLLFTGWYLLNLRDSGCARKDRLPTGLTMLRG